MFWVLASRGRWASSRLQGFLVHRALRAAGCHSRILHAAPDERPGDLRTVRPILDGSLLGPGDIVILQKLDGPEADRLVEHARAAGATTCYVECDHRPEYTLKYRCDFIVCTSEALRAELAARMGTDRVFAIPDPIEHGVARPPRQAGRSYRLVWVGHRTQWESLQPVREALASPEFADLRLVTISDHPDATWRWSARSVFAHWRRADVCVIPTLPGRAARAKSNNRVTQAMALGLTVLCGRIPSYEGVIRAGGNGFLCDTVEEYRNAFRQLRSPEVRSRMAQEGWALATREYGVEVIAREWQRCLGIMQAGAAAPPLPAGVGVRLRRWARERAVVAELWQAEADDINLEPQPLLAAGARALAAWPFRRSAARWPLKLWTKAYRWATRASRRALP